MGIFNFICLSYFCHRILFSYFFINLYFYFSLYLFFSFNIIYAIQMYLSLKVMIVGFRWKKWNNLIRHSYTSKLVPHITKKKDFLNMKHTEFKGLYKMLFYWVVSHITVFWSIYIFSLF